MTMPFDESEARAALAPLRAMPPAVARRRGRGQLATRRVAIWPVLAVASASSRIHDPPRFAAYTSAASVTPSSTHFSTT